MNLEYLFSPTKQFTYPSGKLLDGGKIFVYLKDTTNLATLYSPEGSFVSNPILLDANGRASVRADIAYQYRLEIYTNDNVLLYTCEAFCEGDGSGGFSFVIHDETLSGNGTASSPLCVINIPLAVEDSLTAYEDIVEGKNALVVGVNSAWLNDKLGEELAGKVDRTEFEDCCSAVNATLENKLDSSAFDLSNYYNKQETNDLLEQRVSTYTFAQTMNWVDQTKQDKLIFEYNDSSAISSINGSALAGGSGASGNCLWISGTKVIADTQTLTSNMVIQVLSSFTLSGDHNHFIGMKGGAYRFPSEYEIGSAIANTNFFMPQSGMGDYLPTSSFDSYSSYADSRMTSINNLANSAYTTAVNNFYNKVDWSAFSAYSAQVDPTIINDLTTQLSSLSSNINSNSATWNEVSTTVQTNSAQWNENAGDTEVNNYVYNNSGINNEVNNVVQTNSGAWGSGKTYTGVAPIQVNNTSNEISITGESLSAGPGIDLFESGGYVVISSNGGISFPITGTDGTANYTNNCDCSSFNFTSANGPVGATTRLDVRGVNIIAYPSTYTSASWLNIINAANNRSNCYCIRFTNNMTAVNLDNYSAYDKVTVVHSNDGAGDCNLYWNGNTKVFPSGLYCELVKGTNDQNEVDWFFTTSGWTNNNWWDWN